MTALSPTLIVIDGPPEGEVLITVPSFVVLMAEIHRAPLSVTKLLRSRPPPDLDRVIGVEAGNRASRIILELYRRT